MAKEINEQLGGEWIHTQDDNFPPFFDAVGAFGAEKEYMVSSKPSFILSVEGETIKTTTIPHPNSEPDVKAIVEFTLGEEYPLELTDHELSILPEWKDNKLVQTISPVKSHMKAHTIEMYLNNGELVQVYITAGADGQEVKGKRRYRKENT